MKFLVLKDGNTLGRVPAEYVGDRPRYWTSGEHPPAIDNVRALHTYPSDGRHAYGWVEVNYAEARVADEDTKRRSIYLIGSLRNPRIPEVAKQLREVGFEVFDDWYAAGPEADDKWRDYEISRGRGFLEALDGYACRHVYEFDKKHIDRCDMAVLLMPAGKSAHLELGYKIGTGKPGYIILDQDPDRFDAMYRFAKENDGNVFQNVDGFLSAMVKR